MLKWQIDLLPPCFKFAFSFFKVLKFSPQLCKPRCFWTKKIFLLASLRNSIRLSQSKLSLTNLYQKELRNLWTLRAKINFISVLIFESSTVFYNFKQGSAIILLNHRSENLVKMKRGERQDMIFLEFYGKTKWGKIWGRILWILRFPEKF